jgi:hypothetical protein
MHKDRKKPSSARSPRAPTASEGGSQSRRGPELRKPGRGRRDTPIVGPGGEHGVPYPGDIPNPLAGKYRGCF